MLNVKDLVVNYGAIQAVKKSQLQHPTGGNRYPDWR